MMLWQLQDYSEHTENDIEKWEREQEQTLYYEECQQLFTYYNLYDSISHYEIEEEIDFDYGEQLQKRYKKYKKIHYKSPIKSNRKYISYYSRKTIQK